MRLFDRDSTFVAVPGRLAAAALGAAALMLLVTGCGREMPGFPGGAGDAQLAAHDGGVHPIIMAPPGSARDWPADPIRIEEAALAGDTLTLSVRYGGGCREHTFALVGDGAWMESYPVQTSALLAHDADGDLCRAYIARELRFDLTPLREAYARLYGPGPAVLVLHIRSGDPDGRQATIRYSF